MEKTFIVIPAFNEDTVIEAVIEDVKKSGFKNLIIVDDGSTDESFKVSKKTGSLVLHHALNRGKGAALKTGVEAAKILGAESVVTFDGDGQHDPNDIRKMISKLEQGYDVILGTRSFEKIPALRRVGNIMGNIFTWLIYGLWVNDSQCGFRAFSKKALKFIDTQHDRYEYESEVVREIARHKLKFTEVPIKVLYTEYSQTKIVKQGFVNGLKTLSRIFISEE